MSDEAALLAAITAQPGEDTPRLVYADWLEEHDAPIQANFIRTQCAMASCAAADPDYPDLLERHAELAVQFGRFARLTVPKLPDGIAFYDALGGANNFRRGFLDMVFGEWDQTYGTLEDPELERFCDGLPKLIETTPARSLQLLNVTNEQLSRVLAAPGAEHVAGLTIQLNDWLNGVGPALRTIATAKCAPNLERLYLYMAAGTADAAELARAKFGRLVHLDLPMLNGPLVGVRELVAAPWFQKLRSVRAGASDRPVEAALLTALAKLPHLEVLDLRFQNVTALKALGSRGGFQSLAQLVVWLAHGLTGITHLVKGRFPRLAELELWSVNGKFLESILKAPWLPQLRVLLLRRGMLSDKSVVALSKSAAAANLRYLHIDDIAIGVKALAALGDGSRFPNLTTLLLNTSDGRKITPAEMVAFAKAFSLSQVRHLDLSGWHLGDAGARALASNPALANLTRLILRNCDLGEKGLAALARSPHLQQLIELDVSNNKLKTASAIRDPARLPLLAAVRLDGNAVPPAEYHKLTAARGLVV